jgi:hypothetical protein
VTGRRGGRLLATGGIVGPVAFVAAWSILGAQEAGYSPVEDPISRLAAVGAGGRVPMTAGIIALGAGIGLYATAARSCFGARTAGAAAATAAGALAVAALPLESSVGGMPHAVAAGTSYATLAATPILGSRALADAGRRGLALASALTGAAAGCLLIASMVSPRWVGLLQRSGLTAGHVWIVASAATLLRRLR